MPSQISRHHKKPSIRAFSVYTFQSSFKKSISITPTKRANRSSHCQFACSMVRPFHSFHSLRYVAALPFIRVCLSLTRQSPLHSPGTSCHARFAHTHSLTHSFRSSVHSCLPVAHAPVTATLAWHFVPCSLRLHSFTSSLNSFVPLLRSLTHSTHFTSAPFTCFSHMSSFLLAISTIRVASQWDK